METTIKINNISEININTIKKILEEIILSFGNVEITIKPKYKLKTELLNRIKSVEKGEELLTFNINEFDELNSKILNKEKINVLKNHK